MTLDDHRSAPRAEAPALLAAVLSIVLAAPAAAQEAAEIFRRSCMSCHTIGGGRLVGPDLKDVTARRDRDWLASFIVDPKGFLDRGDPYALKLKQEAGGAVMAPIAGLTRKQADALLDLIEAESALGESQFAGLDLGDEPFTAADVEHGRELFLGVKRLVNGGPSCLACHTAAELPALAGGRLGPDLTRAYERLQGRKPLASWLQAPATEVMRPVFADRPLVNEEIVALVAFLEDQARNRREEPETARVAFLLLGLGGAAAGFAVADAAWRGRFRAVRRPLVERHRGKR